MTNTPIINAYIRVMDRTLFLLLLLTATTPLVLSIPRKYYLIQQLKTWSDARAYCQANYNDLATIDSDANMVRLQGEAQIQQFTGSAWVGLYVYFQSYHWSYGFQPLGSFHPWYPGEPDNWGGYYQCGVICPSGWGDSPCSISYKFVCFDDRYTDSSRFIYYTTAMSWWAAQSYCRQHHTDLAYIRDTTENSAVLEKGITAWTWFGMIRDSLNWLDPTNVAPVKFISGQPNGTGSENCGFISNGLAGDAPCSNQLYFYCYSVQYPTVRIKQTVRFMIKSDQDVNDPTVKAALLEKIQQKLQELGLVQNITLRWKERPDKITFHKMK